VYRAATLPFQEARIDRMALADLPGVSPGMADTLAVPPCRPLQPDLEVRRRLSALDAET
jgi:hypothetical protein